MRFVLIVFTLMSSVVFADYAGSPRDIRLFKNNIPSTAAIKGSRAELASAIKQNRELQSCYRIAQLQQVVTDLSREYGDVDEYKAPLSQMITQVDSLSGYCGIDNKENTIKTNDLTALTEELMKLDATVGQVDHQIAKDTADRTVMMADVERSKKAAAEWAKSVREQANTTSQQIEAAGQKVGKETKEGFEGLKRRWREVIR